MPTPYAYVGIIGGVVALGFLIYSIFTSGPEPQRGYQSNGQPKTNYEPGYDKPRDADWGENEETSNRPSSSRRRRRAQKPECTICTENLEGGALLQLNCSHTFHRNCILSWFKSARENGFDRSCPVCRAQV